MSFEERLHDGLMQLAEPVQDPRGSLARVVASSRMRRRRRRTLGIGVAALLLAGGATLAVAADDSPRVEAARTTAAAPSSTFGETTTTTTTPAATTSTPVAAATTTVLEVAVASTPACGAPLLPTVLPAGFASVVSPTAAGLTVVRESDAGSLTLVGAPSGVARPATGVRRVTLSALSGSAEVFSSGAATVADITIPVGRCGTQAHLVTRGLSAAEVDAVLAGLRPENSCSANGVASSPVGAVNLPAAVAATRTKLRDAAAACDFETLASIVASNPDFLSEVRGVRLADQWRLADARGNQLLRGIMGLLDTPAQRVDVSPSGAVGASYVWPTFAASSTAVMSASDLAVLDRVYGAGYGDRFRNGLRRSYLGASADSFAGGIYIEIRADGVPSAITTR